MGSTQDLDEWVLMLVGARSRRHVELAVFSGRVQRAILFWKSASLNLCGACAVNPFGLRRRRWRTRQPSRDPQGDTQSFSGKSGSRKDAKGEGCMPLFFRFARSRSSLCGLEASRLFPSVPFRDRQERQSRKAAKKAAMTRFSPPARELPVPSGDRKEDGLAQTCIPRPPAPQRGARRQPGVERSGTPGHPTP